MITKVTCTECGASLGIKGVVAPTIECPKCGAEFHTITVDDDEAPAVEERKRKSRAEDDEDEPRRKPARNAPKAKEAEEDKPRKKSKLANKEEESEEDAPKGKKKKKKKKKDADEKKKFPLWIPIAIGGAAVVVVAAVLIINAMKKDDSKASAANGSNATEQPSNDPKIPGPGIPAKKDPPKKDPGKKEPPKNGGNPTPKDPPKKDPEVPPKKDPGVPPKKEPEVPPKKEPEVPVKKDEKPAEDPLALIRTLDANIDIPRLPPPEQRPVLVLNSSGHTGQMVDAFFTPDKKRIVSVSKDKTIRIWDLALGETLKTIYMPNGPGEEGDVEAAALSPDGRRAVVGGRTFGRGDKDALIYLVSLDRGTIERTFKGHKGQITALCFSPNGQWIASGSNDTSIHLFNATTGGLYGVLVGHEGQIRSVAYHPKEARVASACTDGSARIWITSKLPAPFKELQHPKGAVHAVAWSPDGNKLATGGDDGMVRIWSKDGALLKTLEKLEELDEGRLRDGVIYSLCFTKDGKEVIHTGVGAAQTGVFNIETGKHRKIPLHSNTVGSASVSRDGELAITAGGNENEIVIWKVADGAKVKRLAGEGRGIWGLCWSKDGKTLMWGGNNRDGKGFPPMRPVDQAFRIDQFDFGQVVPPKDRVGPTGSIDGFEIVPLSRYEIGVFFKGQPVYKYERKDRKDPIYTASMLTLGRLVVGSAGGLTLCGITKGKILGDFLGHNGQQLSIAVPPNRDWFATGSIDQTIRFYKPDRFDPFLSIFFAGREWIAWTPEGYYCASPNGERLMGWLVESGEYKLGKFFAASQFRQSLYQPEIIRNLFRVNGDLKYAMALLVKERKKPLDPIMLTQVIPPEVLIDSPPASSETGEIQVNEETIEVKATAKSTGKNPVTAMRLIVDGRPYGGNGGLFIIPKPALGEVKKTWRVSLPKGTHSLVVTASSTVSRGMSPTVEVEQMFGDDKLPNLYMLVVGINDYPDEGNKLRYASSDAQTIARVLGEKTKNVFGKVELKLILDRDATRANVMAGLEWLEKNMTPHDVGLFYFSGHGTKDDDDNFYLCTVDIGRDLNKTCVSGDIMKQKLTNMPGRVIAMLDACHSGAAKFSVGRADNLVRDLQNDDCGVIVIAASLGEEYSLESQVEKGGFFTLALAEGLTGKADFNQDGLIQLNELLQYTVKRVREMSGEKQHPASSSSAKIKPFPLTKY